MPKQFQKKFVNEYENFLCFFILNNLKLVLFYLYI